MAQYNARAPLASKPADGAVGQIQISLNNLVGQVRESLFLIAESAPALEDDYETILTGENVEIEQEGEELTFGKVAEPLGPNAVVEVADADMDPAEREKAAAYVPPDTINVEREILQRARNMASILLLIRNNVELLPDSTITKLEWRERIAKLERTSREVDDVFQQKKTRLAELDSAFTEAFGEISKLFDKENSFT